jgi:dTDP-4-amino-4,6-dideoxygalactose transaminase
MRASIPFLRPRLVARQDYQAYLDRIDETQLYSNYGPLNTAFEARVLAECWGGNGAVSTVANATLGLMLAIAAVKRPGAKYALMPSFTFAATPLAAQWCGLEPCFIDVDPRTWCLDQEALGRTLERLGDQVAVVIPYATFGTGMDLAPYESLHRRGIPVVLDAAPCFGTVDERGFMGQGFPGPVVFSFHATKAFGVGEGGLIYSADPDLVARLRRNANFGFSEQRESTQLGLNAKLSEYAAAIALATLDRFPEKSAARQRIHAWYLEGLARSGPDWEVQAARGSVPWQFMSVLCPGGMRDSLLARLAQEGIECRTYFSPCCHQQVQFAGCPREDLRVTEELARRIISLPLWEGMERREVERVLEVLLR